MVYVFGLDSPLRNSSPTKQRLIMIYFCDFWLLDGMLHRMFDIIDSHPISKWCPGMDGSHQTAITSISIDPVRCCLRTSEAIVLCIWPRSKATLPWCTASWRPTPPWIHWTRFAGNPRAKKHICPTETFQISDVASKYVLTVQGVWCPPRHQLNELKMIPAVVRKCKARSSPSLELLLGTHFLHGTPSLDHLNHLSNQSVPTFDSLFPETEVDSTPLHDDL